jgi:hypothetical protein
MPTGHTAGIADGMTFKEFALNCARSYGFEDGLKEIKVDDYITESVKDAIKSFNEFNSMSLKDRKELFAKEKKKGLASALDSINDTKELEKKYRAMLKKVNKFVPPTKEHEQYKKFMIDQINSSIDFDCSMKYKVERLESIKKWDFKTWESDRLDDLSRDVDYAQEKLEEEKKRIKGCNDWIAKLREAIDKV